MNSAEPQSSNALTVCIKKLIRAPRERVYEAWLKPELRRKWWMAKEEEVLTHCEIDAQVGGRYCMKQFGGCDSESQNGHDAKGREWIMNGEFVELVPPERIVFTWNVNHNEELVENQRVTIELVDVDGDTELTLTHVGSTSEKMRNDHNGGWTMAIDCLANYLA